jgi:fumarylacetoacetase
MNRPIDESHDPALRSWVESANQPETEFPIQNLPFGVFRSRSTSAAPRIGVAIGDQVLDLHRCSELGILEELPTDERRAVAAPRLNELMALGPSAMSRLRRQLVRILKAEGWRAEPRAMVPMDRIELLLPAAVGNYTDFYASVYHATNVGRLFRPESPLMPNYKYVPIAYHGRASSIVASGTPVRRPWGQAKPAGQPEPVFQPSRALDFELEVGLFIGAGNELGAPVPIDNADDHIFGLCLLNDWSARDMQAWEYQPLGPFLSKSFATTVSPWVVTLEALAPFRCRPFARAADDPKPLPYLASELDETRGGVDLHVEAHVQSARMRDAGIEPMRLSRSGFCDMYWSMAQMVAHHTSNGCNLRPGDLLGSGTSSGPDGDSLGCLLEMTRQGTRPVRLPSGEERGYLADGDEVILRGYCAREGCARIGFGECRGVILPALAWSG